MYRIAPSPKASSDFLDKLAEKAAQLETKLVHQVETLSLSLSLSLSDQQSFLSQVYEEIAGHFSETRHKPWPRVTQFLSTIPVCLL